MNITKNILLKFIESVLTIIIFFLHYNSYPGYWEVMFTNSEINLATVTTGTYVGFAIFLTGIFIGLFLGKPINSRVDMFYELIGAALFIVSGIMSYNYYCSIPLKTNYVSSGLTKSWLSMTNGIVCIIDAAFAYRHD